MQIVQAPRASAILYSFLVHLASQRPWLLPANICPIVPITFFKAGTPFEFVDISIENLHMDLEQVEGRLVRESFGGVLYAHTYGESSTPIEFFRSIKSRYPEVFIIDDRCLCPPDVEPAGDPSVDMILYSTGYAKIVDLGFGGYAFVQDEMPYSNAQASFSQRDLDEIEKSYKRAVQSRSHFEYRESDWLQTDGDVPAWYDYRQQIKHGLQISQRHRASLNQIYADRLPDEIQLPPAYQSWRFNIRLKASARILKAIFSEGLFASSHYASLAGIMAPGHCPQSEALAEEIINLFNDRNFDKKKAERTCEIILENHS